MLCNAAVQVKEDLIERLLYYLYLAEQAYDAATEPKLKELLSEEGRLACCRCNQLCSSACRGLSLVGQ